MSNGRRVCRIRVDGLCENTVLMSSVKLFDGDLDVVRTVLCSIVITRMQIPLQRELVYRNKRSTGIK